jgi:hypothetical protein
LCCICPVMADNQSWMAYILPWWLISIRDDQSFPMLNPSLDTVQLASFELWKDDRVSQSQRSIKEAGKFFEELNIPICYVHHTFRCLKLSLSTQVEENSDTSSANCCLVIIDHLKEC